MKQMKAAAGQLQDKQREGHGLTSLSDGEGTGRWPTGGAGRRARAGPEGTAAVAASGFRGGGGVGLPQRLGRPAGSRGRRAGGRRGCARPGEGTASARRGLPLVRQARAAATARRALLRPQGERTVVSVV